MSQIAQKDRACVELSDQPVDLVQRQTDQGIDLPRSLSLTKVDRDLRVDLLRGVALLIIFSDHVRGNPVREFIPISLGFSDMAEWFVFLSGYVNGIRRARPIIRPDRIVHNLPQQSHGTTDSRRIR